MKFVIYSAFFYIVTFLYANSIPPGAFSITRIHYDGGGDWYADPSSIPNMLEYLKDHTNIAVNPLEKRAKIGDDKPIDQWLYKEAQQILDDYGNHPSFVMMAYGNEPSGDHHKEYLIDFIKL